MFSYSKIFLTLLLFISASVTNAKLTDNSELQRQYQDYLRIVKKADRPNGFETFVENLQNIDYLNKEGNCRYYLTQNSAEDRGDYHKKCQTDSNPKKNDSQSLRK